MSVTLAFKHNIPHEKTHTPIAVRTLGGQCQVDLMAPNITVEVEGIGFLASPHILKSATINLILGMDWLKTHTAAIYCGTKVVQLFHPSGEMVNCTTQWVRRYMR